MNIQEIFDLLQLGERLVIDKSHGIKLISFGVEWIKGIEEIQQELERRMKDGPSDMGES